MAAIYDGASRSQAATIGGVTLQVVRDWVLRFNARGPEGLINGKAIGPESAGRRNKKGLPDALGAIAAAHPDKRVALWFQEEARVGQKGRTCHAWWLRGQRPPALIDKRFSFAYMFAAGEPATGQSACLVLPEVSTAAMQLFLDSFSATLAPDVQAAALVVDGAGCTSPTLRVPDNVTLVLLRHTRPSSTGSNASGSICANGS